MKKITNVQSTAEDISKIEINVDTIYIRTNIVRIESEEFNGYSYDELQLTYDEFELIKQSFDNENNITELELTVVEQYESDLENQSYITELEEAITSLYEMMEVQ